jgi:hypothetical protein
MAESLYKAAGGTEGAQAGDGGGGSGDGAGTTGGQDDVIDAEYTESPKT